MLSLIYFAAMIGALAGMLIRNPQNQLTRFLVANRAHLLLTTGVLSVVIGLFYLAAGALGHALWRFAFGALWIVLAKRGRL